MASLIQGEQHSFSSRQLHVYAGQEPVRKRLQPQEWEMQIRKLIQENPGITRAQMAQRLNTSIKTIERQLKKIPSIHYEGSARSGEWKED